MDTSALDKSVDIDLIGADTGDRSSPIACGHAQAFSIAVNNLVRNAFEHTLDGQGPITIYVEERVLVITNKVRSEAGERHPPIDTSPPNGYGLGLGIVQRLCERNGWSFSLDIDGTRVTARFSWQ